MRQFALATAVFISSACGLIIEIVAGRLIAPYVGMSLYTWTAIIAVVLAGLSAGHWIGGMLAAPNVRMRQGARRVAGALALASVSSLASLALLRTVSGILLDGRFSPIPSIVLLTTALFLLPSLFVGIVSPILTKLAVDDAPNATGKIIGRMYAFGTLGSILGTLSAGYLFISWIGSSGTIIAVAALYALLALSFALADPLRLVLVAFLAVTGGGVAYWGGQVQAFVSPCKVESDYFCIRVADFSSESGRESTLMVLDNLVHSINDKEDPGYLYSPYIQAVDEITKIRLEPKRSPRAFFIGGGGYSLPRAWADDYAGAADGGPRLIVAEIDPAVTKAARDFLYLPEKVPGLVIKHRDARATLQSLPPTPTFDVIFGDAFRDISIPAHLVTAEFHREVAKRLTPNGFYAVNVVDNGSEPMFLFSLIKTLRRDFPVVEAWIDLGEAGAKGRTTYVVIASKQPTPTGRITSRRGIERSWIRWPEKKLYAHADKKYLPFLTDDFAPVDRLIAPLLINQTK